MRKKTEFEIVPNYKRPEDLLAEKTAECNELRDANEKLKLELLEKEDDGRLECLRALAVLKGAQLFYGQGSPAYFEEIEHLIDVAVEILEEWVNDNAGNN